RTFLALRNGELNFLTFGQGSVAFTFDRLEVREHIRAGLAGDETEALGFVEPFNGTGNCCHESTYLKNLKIPAYAGAFGRTAKLKGTITYGVRDEESGKADIRNDVHKYENRSL